MYVYVCIYGYMYMMCIYGYMYMHAYITLFIY